jgi:hypothetical protein
VAVLGFEAETAIAGSVPPSNTFPKPSQVEGFYPDSDVKNGLG